MNIAALLAVLLLFLGGPAPTRIDSPATAFAPAVRLSQEPPIVLTPGVITDTTGLALPLLQSLYTPNELAAGGPVLIRTGDTDIYRAWVLWGGLCAESPICIELNAAKWPTETLESNRAMMAHEWGHVLTERYRMQMTSAQRDRFDEAYDTVHRECLADSLAAIILERGGYPPSTGRYSCPAFWQEQGLDPVQTEELSVALARTVLQWAA